MYCISCDINGSTEPNFICMMCCCQKCSKKNTDCNCIKNSIHKYSTRSNNVCNKCNNTFKEKCDCKCCWFCNKYSQSVRSYHTYFQGKIDYCYDCYTNVVCKCDKLFVHGKICYSCAKMYEE